MLMLFATWAAQLILHGPPLRVERQELNELNDDGDRISGGDGQERIGFVGFGRATTGQVGESPKSNEGYSLLKAYKSHRCTFHVHWTHFKFVVDECSVC